MLIATRLFAGVTKNGNSRRLIVIKNCGKNSSELHKVIKYSVDCGEYERDLFNGEHDITTEEYRNILEQAKDLNILEEAF